MATVSEIAQGREAEKSDQQGAGAGGRQRQWRILRESVNESVNYESLCGIRIGDVHPLDPRLVCSGLVARPDGDSRLAETLTARYEAFTPDGGDRNQPPDVRPARWTTSASTAEMPVRSWYKRTGTYAWSDREIADNPVGDVYDGVTALMPVVRISITQFEALDPTRHLQWVGCVNSETITLGSLTIRPHQLLFNSLNQTPSVENWGDLTYTGWNAEYEFLYRRNPQRIRVGGSFATVDIGWDIAVPQTGWSVLAWEPPGGADDDDYGQPLRHGDPEDFPDFLGGIVSPIQLHSGVTAGQKCRAHVRVPSYTSKYSSQAPAASPIALNDNGRARIHTAEPLVYAYQPGEAINVTQDLALRLQ